jgi:feruloyl esterase
VESFSHGAHHALAVVSKELVAARYGRPQGYAYYTGCSTGGRQGLAEAQLYPEDYDGIVAGAPANNIVRLETAAPWLARTVGEPLDPPLLTLVANAAVAQCDAQDGIEDGYITDPDGCGFDPASLACDAGDAPGQCLTPEQVETARRMHGRRVSAGGLSLYPGRAYGTAFAGESGPPIPPSATLLAQADSAYDWSLETFDYDRDVPPLEAEFPGLVAMNPDLSAFADAGGKLILWHGWVDPLISPINTLDYFAAVKAQMGEAATTGFARLYMAPGVSHCAGGPGPDTFDALSSLEAWVERGEAPARIIASKLGPDGQPTRTRPLCPYPQVAVYDEGGSADDAASFSCQEL